MEVKIASTPVRIRSNVNEMREAAGFGFDCILIPIARVQYVVLQVVEKHGMVYYRLSGSIWVISKIKEEADLEECYDYVIPGNAIEILE